MVFRGEASDHHLTIQVSYFFRFQVLGHLSCICGIQGMLPNRKFIDKLLFSQTVFQNTYSYLVTFPAYQGNSSGS